jgi:3-oxoacyl-[acyl-carrier protein] reductase
MAARDASINLNGAFYLSRSVLPAMKKKRWGRIVNITSLAAKTGGITAGTAYSTSKGALIALTFSFAAETTSYGITVNGIAPAYIKTPMVTEQLTEEQRQGLLKKIPVGRFCEAGRMCAYRQIFSQSSGRIYHRRNHRSKRWLDVRLSPEGFIPCC